MRLHLIVGCLLSLSMHAGVLLLTPAPSLRPFPHLEQPIDAELVALDVPIPPTLQSSPLSPPPTVNEESQPLPEAGSYDATKITPPDIQRLNGAIEKLSAGVSIQLPAPALQLPTQSQPEDSLEPISPLPRGLSAITSTMLEQSLLTPGLTTGVDKQIGWGQVRLGDKQSPSRLGLPKLDRRLIARALPTTPPLPVPPPSQPQFGIRGPAAKREPLYRPPLPKVRVQIESEITLKFWVRPDGVVSRVLPERKGDAALEAAAIRYLEGWRFTPLPPHEPQVEQWGTITVRFLLHER
jgi:TonB family protein